MKKKLCAFFIFGIACFSTSMVFFAFVFVFFLFFCFFGFLLGSGVSLFFIFLFFIFYFFPSLFSSVCVCVFVCVCGISLWPVSFLPPSFQSPSYLLGDLGARSKAIFVSFVSTQLGTRLLLNYFLVATEILLDSLFQNKLVVSSTHFLDNNIFFTNYF
jgi:hypothetical protein